MFFFPSVLTGLGLLVCYYEEIILDIFHCFLSSDRLNYSSVDRNTITRVIEVKTMVVCSPSIKTVGG